jgi:hypothetical protein
MMNKYLILGALPAVMAGAVHHNLSTTRTVYSTQTNTVTSCRPEVTNCPGKKGDYLVVTEVVPVSTTVCAVTEAEAVTASPVGCAVTTALTDCVHTITSTAKPFVVTTTVAATTITKKLTTVSVSTCTHTIPGKVPETVTTTIPTTVTKDVVETKYTDCVHTVTGATSVQVITTKVPATYTYCPVKPTWSFEAEPAAKPTGVWAAKPEAPEWAPKPTGGWAPEAVGVAPVKPTGTGAWVKPVESAKAVVTAGAATFGASGAIKMLGAAAFGALLL